MVRPRQSMVLIIIDGWGVAGAGPHNAITLARPAAMERLMREFPSTQLEASGPAVGLPEGQMGNSEVGHLNIGAGRIVDQAFVRINKAVARGSLGDQPAIAELLQYAKSGTHALHVMGLLGPGGVHGHESHLVGIVEAAKRAGVPRVFVHHFLDGRDTPPRSALDFAKMIKPRLQKAGARVITVAGRYWAMDRDKRWERTQRAYRMLTELQGETSKDEVAAIDAAYERGETDEFVQPTVLEGAAPIQKGDAVLCYNFRPDRMRQIVRALADPAFKEFPTKPLDLRIVSMTMYDRTFEKLGVRVAFPPDHPKNTLGEVYANLGLRQLRIAETEKYAHVTYFFSGGREEPFAHEERLLVPSPKVATYDLQPAMSAREITNALLRRLTESSFDLVVLNFANPDMVGHTGMLAPTIEAVKVTDECIGRIAEHCRSKGILLAITADHGNAEVMVDPEGRPLTAHTTNPVPFILVHEALKGRSLRGGGLASVAPTLLEAVGLAAPGEMDAPTLLVGAPKTRTAA